MGEGAWVLGFNHNCGKCIFKISGPRLIMPTQPILIRKCGAWKHTNPLTYFNKNPPKLIIIQIREKSSRARNAGESFALK